MKIQRNDPQFREKLERMLEPKTSLDYGMYADVEDIKELCPDLYEKHVKPYIPEGIEQDADLLALVRAMAHGMRLHLDEVVWDNTVHPSVADDERALQKLMEDYGE